MEKKTIPGVFLQLLSQGYIERAKILLSCDGFCLIDKSLSNILEEKNILEFPDADGGRFACRNFFDDWFLYAVPDGSEYAYSLLKLREQEYDAKEGQLADGDTPGVTISFVSFACEVLLDCLSDPTDENRIKLDNEINRVVVRRRQHHHSALRRYFTDPGSEGAYLVAKAYVKHIASFTENGQLMVPEQYKEIVDKNQARKKTGKSARLPAFIESLNGKAGCMICDNDRIHIKNPAEPTEYESAAILATHTGNTSAYSFAAEVEYHARFLTPVAKIRVPFLGRSVYDSAIRADMTIGDTEFEGPAPYHRDGSRIVKRQLALHQDK